MPEEIEYFLRSLNSACEHTASYSSNGVQNYKAFLTGWVFFQLSSKHKNKFYFAAILLDKMVFFFLYAYMSRWGKF